MSRRWSDAKSQSRKTPGIEQLESRFLLSAAIHQHRLPFHGEARHFVRDRVVARNNGSSTVGIPTDVVLTRVAKPGSSPGGISALTPAQLRNFYSVNNIFFNGTLGDGTGETIAIVDAYDQPNLLGTSDPNFVGSDLQQFDQQFGLADPPSFQKLAETTGESLPSTQVSDWSIESSMDVEWAHAMAPGASIILVEADSNSADDLMSAVNTAKNIPGVVAVSMSFTINETAAELDSDSTFSSPAFQNVTFLAAAGDAGAVSTGYPAFSPNVISVGGTAVTMGSADGAYQSETTWNDYHGATGGAPSTIESRPGYQSGLTLAGTTRTVPDVSFDASPSTGVYVYDSAIPGTGTVWYKVGGTSLATPCWASMVAIADQGRATIGLGPLDGSSGALPRLYGLSSADFHDVTTGNNGYNSAGYSAAIGYDLATGRGSPVASSLVCDLAGGATITGQVFTDTNGSGTDDAGDAPVADQTVFLDLNNNGLDDPTEPITTTDAGGRYTFTDQPGNEAGTVRLVTTSVYFAAGSAKIGTAFDATDTINLGLIPGTAGGAAYKLSLDPGGSQVCLSAGGRMVSSQPIGSSTPYTITLANAGDTLTVDGTYGNPVPMTGISVTGTAGAQNAIDLIGTSGADWIGVSTSMFRFDGAPIQYAGVDQLLIQPGAGSTGLNVTSGSATISAGLPGSGIDTRIFSSIAIGSTAELNFATAVNHDDRTLVRTPSLNIARGGTLNLGGNDLVIVGGGGASGSIYTVSGLIASGYNHGQYNGPGILSSVVAADASRCTMLGVASTAVIPVGGNFDGYTPGANDVLVKYTYFGDANLDGRVDGSDYSIVDANYGATVTGWSRGDFNFDGTVDGSDYALIDNAFNNQRGGL